MGSPGPVDLPRSGPRWSRAQVLRGLQQPGLQCGAAAADAGAGAAGVPGERRSHGAGARRPGTCRGVLLDRRGWCLGREDVF